MKTIVIALAATLALGACAQSPDAITPVSMGNAFASVSCRQAQGDLMTERQSLATLSAQQNGAVIGDAIGVFMIGVPTSSLMGGDKAGLISVSKGKILALETRMASC